MVSHREYLEIPKRAFTVERLPRSDPVRRLRKVARQATRRELGPKSESHESVSIYTRVYQRRRSPWIILLLAEAACRSVAERYRRHRGQPRWNGTPFVDNSIRRSETIDGAWTYEMEPGNRGLEVHRQYGSIRNSSKL